MSETRKNISSGGKWEDVWGYCRAVRIGNHVWVAGTVASDEEGEVVGEGDPFAQAEYILQKIKRALNEAGAELHHVVRTRTFVVNASDWEAIAPAHRAAFGAVRPVSTLVEISALIGEGYLLEIEVDAYIHDADS